MGTLDIIKQPVIDDLKKFDLLFKSHLFHQDPLLNTMLESVSQSRGKGMRSLLVLLVAKLLGDINEKSYLSALSYELIHTASLIHDDVLDDSDMRRGRKSMNALYGQKKAILLGDYLLGLSIHVLSEIKDNRVTESVSYASGSLAAGEIMQMNAISSDQVSEAVYFEIIRLKTASLFASSAKGGALSVNASNEHINQFFLFGSLLGEAFQIKDDIFDYYENEQLGKPTGNDLLEGKLTLPLIYALKSTKNKDMFNLALKVKHGISSVDDRNTLISFSIENRGIQYAENMMHQKIDEAKTILFTFPDCAAKQSLLLLSDMIGERTY